MRKGQIQAISMVLIAGVVISLVGAAYFWGKPMIEKRSTLADISNAKSFMVQLDKYITEVARNGGSKAISVPKLPGASLSVVSEDEITLRFFTTQAMIDMGDESVPVPVETFDQSNPGPYGGSPRIITLEGTPSEDGQYLMTVRLKYRELRDEGPPPKGYKIEIEDGGNVGVPDSSMSGDFSVGITYSKSDLETRSAENGGDLTKTIVKVAISGPS